MIVLKLTECEVRFLTFYLNNHNAKWMLVFDNKHPIFETRVQLYSIFKRKLKTQPIVGQRTYTNMFNQLIEGKWYFIPHLLKNEKEGKHCLK